MKEYIFFVCSLNYIMPLGKHKGETILFIYRFDPNYLEWLVRYRKPYMIYLPDFEKFLSHPIKNLNISKKGYVNFEGKKLKFRDYIENHTNIMQEFRKYHSYIPCPFNKSFVVMLRKVQQLLENPDSWEHKMKYKYNQLLTLKIDEEEFQARQYENYIINEIENNAAANERLSDFIKSSNRDYYDEFNGFYHEDME